ncbi:MAG: ATPase, T2SS/T4P/T4SS family [Candidatus Micrarchaeia archaeon]
MIGIFGRRRPEEQAESPITFKIDSADYGAPIEEASFQVPRAITRRNGSYFYVVGYNLKPLSAYESKLMSQIKAKIIAAFTEDNSIDALGYLEQKVYDFAKRELSQSIPLERASYLSRLLVYDTVGFGAIGILLEDRQGIEEIEVNEPTMPIKIYHARYGHCTTNISFSGQDEFYRMLNKFIAASDKELTEGTPIIDAQLDNARVHAQAKPYAPNGPAATIRLGGRKDMSPAALIERGMANAYVMSYLWLAVESNLNIIIAGAPASGKTTLMSSLLSFVPRYKRIITIEEDINELKFYPNVTNVVSLYGSRYYNMVQTREQVVNALRMRPDRLVVGEIRAAETKELFSGANIGVPFMTTLHSNEGGVAVLKRLVSKPMEVDMQALSSLDLAVYVKQGAVGRVISSISEYKWLSRGEDIDGAEPFGDDSVNITQIVENGELNTELLKNSRVISAYSRLHSVPKSAAIKEIQSRSSYLKNIGAASADTLSFIEKIYEYGESK